MGVRRIAPIICDLRMPVVPDPGVVVDAVDAILAFCALAFALVGLPLAFGCFALELTLELSFH